MKQYGSWLLLMVLTAALPSCAPHKRGDAERIDSLRVEAEQLIQAQAHMGWNAWAFGAPSQQDSLYRAHADLFTRENIAVVRAAETEEQDSVQRKRLWYLRRYLTTEYLSKHVAPLTDSATNYEAAASIRFEGKEIPYRQFGSTLANEGSQKRRLGLYAAADPVFDSLNTILIRVEETSQRIARELGYASYTAMVEELKGISLTEFSSVTDRVLAETEMTYTGLLREAVQKELGLQLSQLHRADIGALFRSRRYDKFFSSARMLDLARSTYNGLGIDLSRQKNLLIDAEARPGKNPRAVCFAIEVPTDVRLSIKPIGGFDDYRSLFHELGHALHYANTQEQAFEFKYLGEPTVTETYAFLSEYVLVNQAWLRLQVPMPAEVQKDFLRSQALYRLYFQRRYCAKLRYEMELHSGIADAPARYSRLLSAAIGYHAVPSDSKRYLTDTDAMFYSAGYLRAWFLEAQLNAKLTHDYGANWFENPLAGTYLLSLWAHGDRFTGEELARALGDQSITPDALLAEIGFMIQFAQK